MCFADRDERQRPTAMRCATMTATNVCPSVAVTVHSNSTPPKLSSRGALAAQTLEAQPNELCFVCSVPSETHRFCL